MRIQLLKSGFDEAGSRYRHKKRSENSKLFRAWQETLTKIL